MIVLSASTFVGVVLWTDLLVSLQVLLDLLLLAETDGQVLHLASNLSRLAFALVTNRHKRIQPFYSVDGAMCYHWQICCVLDPDASSTMC